MRKLLLVALSLLPVAAMGETTVSYEPQNFNIAVSTDGAVSGNRHLNVRVSRSEEASADEENCRKISRISVLADGDEMASADIAKPSGLCRFMSSDAPLRGEIVSEQEARELCADGDKTASLTKEVEVVFTSPSSSEGEGSSWTEESADIKISVSCGSTCPLPVIGAQEELPVATSGRSYSTTLSATGYGPMTFSHVDGNLPPGVLLSANGLISGNPAAPGVYSFTVQVKDSCPSQASAVRKKMTLRVEKPCPRLSLGGEPALPDATVGRSYTFKLPVAGAGQGVNVVVASGRLPDGLTMSAQGVISGIPVSPGIRSFTLGVSDMCGGENRSTERPYSITVFQSVGLAKPEKQGVVLPQRKSLDAVEKVRRARDEASAALMKFDEDMEIYRKAVLDYNVRLGSCNETRFTEKDHRAAGCSAGDSASRCSEKVIDRCLGDLPAKLEDARRKVREDAAGVRGAALNIEEIAGKLP